MNCLRWDTSLSSALFDLADLKFISVRVSSNGYQTALMIKTQRSRHRWHSPKSIKMKELVSVYRYWTTKQYTV